MIKRSSYIEQMEQAIDEGGTGSAIKMEGLRELLNENTRTAGRLVSRMSDRVAIENTVKHYALSWRDTDGSITPINHDGREYIDYPKNNTKEILQTIPDII